MHPSLCLQMGPPQKQVLKAWPGHMVGPCRDPHSGEGMHCGGGGMELVWPILVGPRHGLGPVLLHLSCLK